jgi:Uma2 family endonuclease
MATGDKTDPSPLLPGPAWEIATLFPEQGHIGEGDYLSVTDHTNRLVELVNGRIEILPNPTPEHQQIVLFLINRLRALIGPAKLGRAIMAPERIRLPDGNYREPDVVFMLLANLSVAGERYWDGADLVMEVVGPNDPERDYVIKRRDYAAAKIREYWIVDPPKQTIRVLRLENGYYVAHNEATKVGRVGSALLKGFTVEAAEVFAAGRNGK